VSRLGDAFAARPGRTGLIPFLTAGYPSLDATGEMLLGLAPLGVTAVELGVPFSDPIADGPDIQRSSEWAVGRGVGLRDVLGLVADVRRHSDLPIVAMTYLNPVARLGIEAFAAEAAASGLDGVLVSDLPADESPETWQALDRSGLDTILLVAPTTPEARLPVVLARARGFLYCLARTGVTGSGGGYAGSLPDRIADLRGRTHLPVAVGFGIATAADAAALRGVANAVVVGAAFMRTIARDPLHGATQRVLELAGTLERALQPD
jgi:tryptophan synthase alpha chain